jgi:hypothetical protein
MWNFQARATRLALLACSAAMAAGAADAATISGAYNGMNWTATSTIVGVDPTGQGTVVIPPSPVVRLGPGGNPTYLPEPSKHSGVAALIMTYNDGSRFICSGSLLGDRRSIATAGHCVSSGGGVEDADLVNTTAYFWDYATQGDDRVALNPEATAIDVTDYFVNSKYTGEVIDQNDIAVLTLSEYAPEFAQSYDLYANGDLTGKSFNVAGYGGRSGIGGDTGVSPLSSTGWLREGDNRYDFRMGDADFDDGTGHSIWEQVLAGDHGELDYSYVSDFDNGLFANDASCQAVVFGLGGPATAKYCNGGLGLREVGVAGGDSGGPGFIDGRLASINSYGLTFGSDFGDVDNALNSSFGEFSGYVPIFLHEKFIRTAMVPEPSTWALMIGGFGLAGASLRRRRPATAKA